MELIHQKIDLEQDKGYVLERHCRVNYECDCPWARKVPYAEYRKNWFRLSGQIEEFLSALAESMLDHRTIAEIIQDASGGMVGYLWAPFHANDESGFFFAEVQDIYVEEAFRGAGIASNLFEYVENKARENGARAIRSGTGCENVQSIGLHQKMGYAPYRYEFEKLL